MQIWRRIYSVLGWLFFAAVLMQIFLAGLGALVDPSHWEQHSTFVHFFELIPVLLFGVSFPAKMKGEGRWLPVVAFVLVGLQYATSSISPNVLAGLHPVNAVLIAGLGFRMARNSLAAPSE